MCVGRRPYELPVYSTSELTLRTTPDEQGEDPTRNRG